VAPVAQLQITYLGVPGTTGMPWIDYIIADRYVIPEESAQYFTEKPLYMPHCFQVSDNKREVASKPSRADYLLPEDLFVFCSFNNSTLSHYK
jgi:predicted O-linked N-acetylglucosamine transferase (SPINDLY family)